MLKPVVGGRDRDPLRVLRREAEALERSLEPGWPLVVLDERGRRLTSEAFAAMLADHETRSTPGLAFVIGSDLGLARDLTERADSVLSLGPMTLTHRIARLVLWEQIFRATQILGGGGYHRPGVGS
jgi:23S rRNA (pseudouridine1915-N3)-methyltransferase